MSGSQPLLRADSVSRARRREIVIRTTTAAACVLALTVCGLAMASSAGAAGRVTFEGYAWSARFDDGIKIDRGGGATIYISEHPELKTTAGPDGYWSLEVPDRESVTPCAELQGHHPTCDQTFFTRGRDLNQVNFQMVDDTIAGVLSGLSGAETEVSDGVPRDE